jgi:ferredoxin, 2Fe-2S
MPFLTIINEDKKVEVEEGISILKACQNQGIELDHACGGVCACSTCHIWVETGMENLSEMQEDEEDQLDDARGVELNSRLGCQSIISGDISIRFPKQRGLT